MSNLIFEEFHKRREEGNRVIFNEDYLPFKRFWALDSRAYEEGVIPKKYKELMGLTVSLALRCNDCVLYHIDSAAKCGCTREEIVEAFNISLVIGGSIVIPHLRFAMNALDEIKNSNHIC